MSIYKIHQILTLGETLLQSFKMWKNPFCTAVHFYRENTETKREGQNMNERKSCVRVCVCVYTLPIRSICLLSHRPVKKDDTQHLSSHVLLTQAAEWEMGKKEKESPVHSLWKLSPARFSQRTAAQAATCVAFLLTRIVNVPWIIKQSLLRYDTFHPNVCVWSPGTSCRHRGQSKLSDSSLHELTSAEESAFVSPGFFLYFISYSDTLLF